MKKKMSEVLSITLQSVGFHALEKEVTFSILSRSSLNSYFEVGVVCGAHFFERVHITIFLYYRLSSLLNDDDTFLEARVRQRFETLKRSNRIKRNGAFLPHLMGFQISDELTKTRARTVYFTKNWKFRISRLTKYT